VFVDPIVVKVFVVALCAAVSLSVGMAAGILARADGASLPATVQRGVAAFAGTLFLAVAVLTAVGVL
jgi:hypothetical protein